MALLKLTGDWGKFKGDKDAKSTVKLAEAKAEFEVDQKKKPVLKPKAKKEEKPAEEAAPADAPEAAEAADAAPEAAADAASAE